MNMSSVKKSIICSLCVALCIVLPQTLRFIPNAELVYKAMHIPVFLCGLLCGGAYGLLCAFVGVCVSALISGVPTVIMLPVLMTECALYGVISGVGMRIFAPRSSDLRVLMSLVFAMLIGRLAAGAVAALLFSPSREALALWMWAYLIAGLPGFIVQLILIPTIIKTLVSSTLIPELAVKAPAKPDMDKAAE